jgi:hypothetical protein
VPFIRHFGMTGIWMPEKKTDSRRGWNDREKVVKSKSRSAMNGFCI